MPYYKYWETSDFQRMEMGNHAVANLDKESRQIARHGRIPQLFVWSLLSSSVSWIANSKGTEPWWNWSVGTLE